MRRGLAIAGVSVGLLMAQAAPAAAATSYCSPSGDVCFGVRKIRGTITLQITTEARYFASYRLCVKAPGGRTTCRTFRIHHSGSQYGSSVRWSAHFPNRGSGIYRAQWGYGPGRVGPPSIHFRIP